MKLPYSSHPALDAGSPIEPASSAGCAALLNKFGEKSGVIDLSLERITEFLEKAGSPHQHLPPVIHVAGTNGKGSTIAFLKAIIEAGGQSCHVYTSPHLVQFNERIVLNGKEISDDLLYEILLQLDHDYKKYNIKLTFFELTTAAAFIAFAKFPADYLLLETGLGGRYDATNVITKPKLTIITPISFDHTEFLGSTLDKIAYEKAGIIKDNVLCISAPQAAEAKEVLKNLARQKNAKLLFADDTTKLPPLSLIGAHQKINAATARLAAQNLGLSDDAIIKGLSQAEWPARMQQLKHGPLVEMLPKGFELWLDGAHNIDGAKVLATEIGAMKKPVYLVIGMLNNKDASGYLQILKDKVAAIYTIPIPGEANSFTAEELKNIAENHGIKAYIANNAGGAIKHITTHETRASGIFICGSLYLAGHILKDNS